MSPATFVDVVGCRLICRLLCEYLPHSMHPTCKLLNFLKLRITCRAAVAQISKLIGWRVVDLLRHAIPAVREAALKIRHSGFLMQLQMPGRKPGQPPRLKINRQTGIPWGMSLHYWDRRQYLKLTTGWTHEGKLEL